MYSSSYIFIKFEFLASQNPHNYLPIFSTQDDLNETSLTYHNIYPKSFWTELNRIPFPSHTAYAKPLPLYPMLHLFHEKARTHNCNFLEGISSKQPANRSRVSFHGVLFYRDRWIFRKSLVDIPLDSY